MKNLLQQCELTVREPETDTKPTQWNLIHWTETKAKRLALNVKIRRIGTSNTKMKLI